MRRLGLFVLLVSIFAASVAGAQQRKPGLYDLTITTTTVSPSAQTYPPHTIQVCLTQDMIDKYGAIVPDNFAKVCQLVNVIKRSGGMSADMVCSGGMNGKGTLKIDWTDSEHSRGTLHFSGTMQPGETPIKIEWTAESSSSYKGPDCSSLQQPAPPAPPPTSDSSDPSQ